MHCIPLLRMLNVNFRWCWCCLLRKEVSVDVGCFKCCSFYILRRSFSCYMYRYDAIVVFQCGDHFGWKKMGNVARNFQKKNPCGSNNLVHHNLDLIPSNIYHISFRLFEWSGHQEFIYWQSCFTTTLHLNIKENIYVQFTIYEIK